MESKLYIVNVLSFYDTKLIFEDLSLYLNDSSLDTEKSNLENVYSVLKGKTEKNGGKIKIITPENFPNYVDLKDEKYHDASYDAFVTGIL